MGKTTATPDRSTMSCHFVSLLFRDGSVLCFHIHQNSLLWKASCLETEFWLPMNATFDSIMRPMTLLPNDRAVYLRRGAFSQCTSYYCIYIMKDVYIATLKWVFRINFLKWLKFVVLWYIHIIFHILHDVAVQRHISNRNSWDTSTFILKRKEIKTISLDYIDALFCQNWPRIDLYFEPFKTFYGIHLYIYFMVILW